MELKNRPVVTNLVEYVAGTYVTRLRGNVRNVRLSKLWCTIWNRARYSSGKMGRLRIIKSGLSGIKANSKNYVRNVQGIRRRELFTSGHEIAPG